MAALMAKGKNKESIPEFIDRFLIRTTVGVFVIMIAYSLEAAQYLVTDAWAAIFDKIALVCSLSVFVIVLPVFIRFVWLRAKHADAFKACDGYIVGMSQKAGSMAFSLTFVFLILLEVLSRDLLSGLPTAFYLKVITGFTLGVFSFSFFLALRGDGDDIEDVGDFGEDETQ